MVDCGQAQESDKTAEFVGFQVERKVRLGWRQADLAATGKPQLRYQQPRTDITWKNRPYGRFGRILVQLVPQPPTALAALVAPTAVMLIVRQRGQREGNMCCLAWGTSLLSLLFTLQLYLGYSCCAVRTYVPSICLEYQPCLARTYATAILGVVAFSRSESCCSNAKNIRFYFTCKLYAEKFCS